MSLSNDNGNSRFTKLTILKGCFSFFSFLFYFSPKFFYTATSFRFVLLATLPFSLWRVLSEYFRHFSSCILDSIGATNEFWHITSRIYSSTFFSVFLSQRTKKITIYLAELYHKCQPSFVYRRPMKDHKSLLTKPSEGVQNSGKDNSNGDFIFRVGDVLSDTSGTGGRPAKMYLVESLLGHGSFGQVLKCVNLASHETYAVKVIKNLPAYNRQAQYEKKILHMVFCLHNCFSSFLASFYRAS
jgi:hypothetical protein